MPPAFMRIDASERAGDGSRSQPSTPVSRSKPKNNRSSNESKAVPFRIPSSYEEPKHIAKVTGSPVSNNTNIPTPKKNSRTRSVLTNSPPSPARSSASSLHLDTQRDSGDFSSSESLFLSDAAPPTVSSPSPSRRRVSSFTHVRCLNCDQQFVVHRTPRNSPSNNGDFCSGECRCSFLATGIDQQYLGYREERSSAAQTFVLNSSDDEDMNVDSEDDDYD
jgi:hypothetical protein